MVNVAGSDEMRDRTSSVVSAPGIMPGHQHYQQQSHLPHSQHRLEQVDHHHQVVDERETGGNVAESVTQLRSSDRTVDARRPVSKTLSNPVVSANNVFHGDRNQFVSTVNDPLVRRSEKMHDKKEKQKEVASTSPKKQQQHQQQYLNRSLSANLLDSSQSYEIDSSRTAAVGNLTASTSTASIATTASTSTTVTKEKKKGGIWSIWSRNKQSSSSLGGATAKQKSATLGREKASTGSKSVSLLTKDKEDNLKHRWSTGLPRMQPLPANISKDQLVSRTLVILVRL